MFTGIIETTSEVINKIVEGTNCSFIFKSAIIHELKIDQSLAHNGVCLTIVAIEADTYRVTAIEETLKKTTLGNLEIGSKVNIERCMPANGRFDGHIVQGHIDQVGICANISVQDGSWIFDFIYESENGNTTVEKGSIAINGVSLTVFNSKQSSFSVAIIPYTYQHTTFSSLKIGDKVNLEFDIIGKYIQKMLIR